MNAPHIISTDIFNRMRVFETPQESASHRFAAARHDSRPSSAADNNAIENDDNDNVAASETAESRSGTLEIEVEVEAEAEAEAEAAETTVASRSEDSAFANGRCAAAKMMMSSPPAAAPAGGAATATSIQTDSDGLILPKKLINPCLESTDRKELHRELKFNTKIGKNVLNQKSELQRAYERQRERQQQHNLEQQQQHSPTAGIKSELSRVIMERAQKHERQQHQQDGSSGEDDERQYVNPEYLNVRAKLRAGQRAAEAK